MIISIVIFIISYVVINFLILFFFEKKKKIELISSAGTMNQKVYFEQVTEFRMTAIHYIQS